jgi:uncharacterized protein YjbI with pentapeptide repeats
MKVRKPDHLSLLFRTLVFPEKPPTLVISALAGFRFGAWGEAEMAPESEVWPEASAHLADGEVLDLGYPKASAEFLVYGSCYAAKPVQEMVPRVVVAGKGKSLLVVGDRQWTRGRRSAAKPFKSMPICWENAFGGPDYEKNPLGKGYDPEGVDPAELPNILPFGSNPKAVDHAEPAGFSGVPSHWPQRRQYMGVFDAAWLRTRWPYLPQGVKNEFYFAGQADQRLPGYLTGNESVIVENMHPEKPWQEFMLPGVRARAFVNMENDPATSLSEVPLRLDTLFLFPEEELGLLLFRGSRFIRDLDRDDVLWCVAGLEDLDATPRPVSWYEAQLAAPAAEAAPEPKPAPPPPAAPPAPAPAPPPKEHPAVAEMKTLGAGIDKDVDKLIAEQGMTRAQVEKKLAESDDADLLGQGAEEAVDPKTALKNLEAAVNRLEAEVHQSLAKQGLSVKDVEGFLAKKQAEDPDFGLKELIAQTKESAVLPMEAKTELLSGISAVEGLAAQLGALAAKVEKAQPKQKAEEQPEALEPPKPTPAGPKDGDEALAWRKQGKSLAGYDMRGFDFSGMDLSGTDFSESLLDGAKFSGAKLSRANFSSAELAETDFSSADCSDARLRAVRAFKANFTKAKMRGADLVQADATGAVFQGAELDKARLDGALFESCVLTEASLREVRGMKTRFLKTKLDKTVLEDANLEGVDFEGSDLSGARMARFKGFQARFGGAACEACDLRQADLRLARADEKTNLAKANLSGADLTKARMGRARFPGADFSGAALDKANLDRADCSNGNFSGASMESIRLHKANLQYADLTRTNLFNANLRMANAAKAKFRQANLYGAEVFKAVLAGADLASANLKRTLLKLEALNGG